MSSVSLPVTRPTGRALLVGSGDCRQRPLGLLHDIGFVCVEADDPYSAMVELSRRPQAYRAMILSLQSLYREELSLIATVKARFPQVEIWLTDIDGRQASLADAMRLGADGLLGDDGLHRVAMAAPAETGTPARSPGSKRHARTGRSRRNRPNRAPAEPTARPGEQAAFQPAAPSAPASLPQASGPAASTGSITPLQARTEQTSARRQLPGSSVLRMAPLPPRGPPGRMRMSMMVQTRPAATLC